MFAVGGFCRHLRHSSLAVCLAGHSSVATLRDGGQLAIHQITTTRHSIAQTIPRFFLVLLDCPCVSSRSPFVFDDKLLSLEVKYKQAYI